jgi:hypothetical protein
MTEATSPPSATAPPVRDLQAEAFTAVAQAADHGELLSTERFAALLLLAGRMDGWTGPPCCSTPGSAR